jgi:predicted MPP superfamily phosphohydrolase
MSDSKSSSAHGPLPSLRLTRRRWLKRAVAATVALGAGVVVDTFWIEPHWLEIVRRDLSIRNLPAHWQGRTLMQISDVHVGERVSDDYLIRSFKHAVSLVPDVVVVTGDFVSCSRDGTVPAVQARHVYAHLPQGKLSTLGVLGNHDYGLRWTDARVAAKVQDVLQDCGVRMLRNELVDLDGLKIVGLDDLWSGRCNGHTAFSGESATGTQLALCHNPDAADQDHWPGFQGWILSGHTHGGQCKPPFLPPPMLPVENHRYTAGEFDLYDGRRLYICRGLGHLLSVRFNCRPEITVFRLMEA